LAGGFFTESSVAAAAAPVPLPPLPPNIWENQSFLPLAAAAAWAAGGVAEACD
jgi:hypothetical protein